ncbi:GTP pyrophosphokinase [Thalassobellus citreus]|uniref:GTP pyrophosphokinase n=1 Tax=Thalassobellus citreus TaxID=3367752 RepID=UPI00378DB3AC
MNHVEKYKELKPIYESFSQSLVVLLKSILDANNIKFHLVEGRSKDIESFKNKVESKKGKYKNPLKEVMDLCGVRIIVYYQTDIDKIDSLIRENFDVDLKNSVDKSTILKSNEFGYLSNHYIVTINSIRSHLPEWAKFNGLNAEIQLRTVLQHSWAAISHELEYKSKFDIPDLLKRKLFRLAGLFELADEQFVQVKQKQFELSKAIENKTDIENISIYNELNLDTIKHYFSENKSISDVYRKFGEDAGFEYSPEEDEDSNRYLSHIVNISKTIGINSIEEFNETLEKSKEFAGEYLKLQFLRQDTDESGERTWMSDEIFLIYLVLMSLLNEKELENYNPKDWAEDILESVLSVIRSWKKK